MEAEVPCVEVVYQRLVQLVARAFYASDLKVLFAEDESEKAPLPSERKKKQPVLFSFIHSVPITSCCSSSNRDRAVPSRSTCRLEVLSDMTGCGTCRQTTLV